MGILSDKCLDIFRKITSNKIITNIIKACITIGIFYFLFRKIDIAEVSDKLQNYNLLFLFINILLGAGVLQLLLVIRLNIFLKHNNIKTTFRELTKFHYISLFFQSVLPSAFGADAVKIYYLRDRSKLSKVGAVVFLCRFIGIFILFLISYLFLVLFNVEIPGLKLDLGLVKILFLIILVFTGLVLFFKPFSFLSKMFKNKKSRVLRFLKSIEEIYDMKLILITLIFSILIQLVNISMIYIFFSGIGIYPDAAKCLIYIPVVYLFMFIVPSINGMGVREYLLYNFFKAEVGSIENMFIITMAIFVVHLIVTFSGGAVYFFKKRK